MKKTARFMALLLGISASTAAFAEDNDHAHGHDAAPPVQQLDGSPATQLTLLLSHYHEAPTAADLQATGLPMPAALIALAEDDGNLQLTRSRAIDALQYYPEDATFAFAERFLALPASDDTMVLTGRTVRLVGDHLTRVDAERALTLLEPIASHPNPVVRTHLVDTLSVVRAELPTLTPRVDVVLLDLAKVELDPAVSMAIEDTFRAIPPVRALDK